MYSDRYGQYYDYGDGLGFIHVWKLTKYYKYVVYYTYIIPYKSFQIMVKYIYIF